ncbi:MAG: tetratricopeptide repeat protein [Saccharothrix sp.]|nr:tetratricopeptide repeat protein [Saccharothrix sp.]
MHVRSPTNRQHSRAHRPPQRANADITDSRSAEPPLRSHGVRWVCRHAEHPSSAPRRSLTSRDNLASAYGEAGDLGRAVPLYEATLTDSERVLGPDHPTTRIIRSNLAEARAV